MQAIKGVVMNGILDIKPTIGGAPTNMQIGYFFMRIMLGMNLFFHGFMRIVTGVSAWEIPMAATFEDTFLPMTLVHTFLSVSYTHLTLPTSDLV